MDGQSKFAPHPAYGPAVAWVTQVDPITTVKVARCDQGDTAIATARTKNLIFDDVRQLVCRNPKTGGRLTYKVFVPQG